MQEWDIISEETVRAAFRQVQGCLEDVLRENGGRFEHL